MVSKWVGGWQRWEQVVGAINTPHTANCLPPRVLHTAGQP